MYKIVAMILARRLKFVRPNIIDANQPSFLSGRNILDSMVVVEGEALYEAKSKKESSIVLKVEYEKSLRLCHMERLVVYVTLFSPYAIQ